MTAAGKTDEAKSDLARLAIIRAQREEAAKKRELEQKGQLLLVKKCILYQLQVPMVKREKGGCSDQVPLVLFFERVILRLFKSNFLED